MKEFYSILGVSESASAEEIKRAYKKKAMELHPDRHGGDKSKEAEFKKLNEAYSVLSDETKKAHYDRFWSMDGAGNPFWWGGFQQGFDVDLWDIFSSFFWGGFPGGGRGGKRKQVGADIEIELKISLEDAIKWTSRKIAFKKEHLCHHCNGRGWETRPCKTCQWSGQVRERIQTVFWVMEQARSCHVCHGTGQEIIEICEYCDGAGRIEEKVEKNIDVPAGIENGMSIKMRDEWHAGADGNGDLYIVFSVPEREGWLVRDGATLYYAYEISPAAAALGVEEEIMIPILGKKILDISPWTQSGDILTFRSEWVARIDKKWVFWDLKIEINVRIPKKLSADEKELYLALLQAENGKKMKKGWFNSVFD
jgi:molecular chaperone DnaJ